MTTEVYQIIVKAALHAFFNEKDVWSNYTAPINLELISERNIDTCIRMTDEIKLIQSD